MKNDGSNLWLKSKSKIEMDTTIRSLLGKAEQENSKRCLHDAYGKLKGARTNTSDQTDPFHSDLYVICGEVALKVGWRMVFTKDGYLQ